ncbi:MULTISPECIES: hypothetical protein [Shewanella]|uniref:hypothetical protein n=2 Tax=Shewanellaceae TaxID=267890 RepID=UPI000CC3F3E0|nr:MULTISPECIES: hypothetical protein [Shewanella]NCQ43587.1 hypothetical protein [Shewanella frigidimarina]NCO69961.1 hypothetical protein [Shewanella vesiculosa]NCP35501.1 hypothetical protein [Shewanella vesiculosa]NCP68082.1 hypothetical protein [Shewanella vesiculosa]NCP72958.1 hypothetical protein [Shewanella vesiculosa]
MNLIESFNLLLAQRQVMLSSFQCMPKNIEDNTQSLTVILKMIQQKKDPNWPLLCANTQEQIVDAFETDVQFSPTDKVVILSLLLQLHYKAQPTAQSHIVEALFASSLVDASQYSPAFALMASQLQFDKVSFTASNKTPEQIQQYILLCIYRGKRLKRNDGINSLNIPRSSLTSLYIEMLMSSINEPIELYGLFSQLDYCHSALFEVFIISLDEAILTKVFNLMSQNVDLTLRVIELMGYSGFSKFVPFLARAMQQPNQTLVAFSALRTILGPELDQSVPYQWQFEEDEAERCEYLQFYSAKLLHRWMLLALKMPEVRLINGIEVNPASIDKIIRYSSPVHQRIAYLHKLRLNNVVNHSPQRVKVAL